MRYLTHRNLLNCEGPQRVEDIAKRRVWRWRDGRAREHERAHARRARGAWTTWSGWSTATCSGWTARCAAMAASSTSWSACLPGAGWNVVKLVWGQRLGRPVCPRPDRRAGAHAAKARWTGRCRPLRRKTGASTATTSSAKAPELAALAQGMTDEQIDRLKRGGHDLVKIHAAYAAAAAAQGPAHRDPGPHQEGLRHGHGRARAR